MQWNRASRMRSGDDVLRANPMARNIGRQALANPGTTPFHTLYISSHCLALGVPSFCSPFNQEAPIKRDSRKNPRLVVVLPCWSGSAQHLS